MLGIKAPGETTSTLPGGLWETQNPSPSFLIDFSEPGSLCSNKASYDLDMRHALEKHDGGYIPASQSTLPPPWFRWLMIFPLKIGLYEHHTTPCSPGPHSSNANWRYMELVQGPPLSASSLFTSWIHLFLLILWIEVCITFPVRKNSNNKCGCFLNDYTILPYLSFCSYLITCFTIKHANKHNTRSFWILEMFRKNAYSPWNLLSPTLER